MRALTLVFVALPSFWLAACTFDVSGIGWTYGSLFDGCFESGTTPGILLGLDTPDDRLLVGFLGIAEGADPSHFGQRGFALEGEARTEQLAVLQGTLAGSGGDQFEIRLLRSVSGTIRVRIANDPPLGPLEACGLSP